MNIDDSKNEENNDLIAEENPSEDTVLGENETVVSETDDEIVEEQTPVADGEEQTPAADNEPSPAVKTAAAAASPSGMGALPKLLILVGILVLVGAGLVFWKNKVGAHSSNEAITKKDMELILADMNPMMLRQLTQNPEAKKELANNVRELFAIASQAEKEGVAGDANVKRELENIDYEILAVTYDKAINKDKGSMPPFGFISEEQVNQFWNGEGGSRTVMDSVGLGTNNAKSREAAFQRFLDAKIALAKEGGNIPADREISEEEIKQAKDYFAKTRIYYDEAMSKKGVADSGLPEDFFQKVALQTRLQKAQFLARRYATKQLAERVKVTDEDIKKYIEEHPELGSKEEKKAKAEDLLAKVKSGGDFEALAKEFSDDPGSKEKGGLYEGITEGAFVPEFEKAAFSMKPGEIYPELVPTRFGYHIIKLEKLGEAKGADGQVKRSFDARHILISTMFKDPADPAAREMPVEDYVKAKLEKEKEEKVLEEIKASNPIEVAEDFEVPNPPPAAEQPQLPPGMDQQQMSPEMQKQIQEQMQQQMQQQQQLPPGAQVEEDKPKTAPKPAQPKK